MSDDNKEGAGVPLHVGDSKFESWFASKDMKHLGTKQLARDAYAAGMSDYAAMPAAPSDAAEARYRFLLGFLIERGVLTNDRYSNGMWCLRGIYGVDDSGLRGAGRTAEEAIDNAIVAANLDPATARMFWQTTHAALSQTMQPQAGPDMRYAPIIKAAINLLAACQERHDTLSSPQKYSVPYGEVVALHDALNGAPAAVEQAGAVARSEHYDEVKATLQGAHRIMETVSSLERRVGPVGSHARGYTHKITKALRHLDALAAPGAAIAAREQEVERLFAIIDSDRQEVADALHGYKGAPQNDGDIKRLIERARLASPKEAPATPQALMARIEKLAADICAGSGPEESLALVSAFLRECAALTQPTTVQQAAPVDPAGKPLNDAGWAFVNALPEGAHLNGHLWNNLKPTLKVAIEAYLASLKTAQTTALPGGNGEGE